jgi:hypothetical protein
VSVFKKRNQVVDREKVVLVERVVSSSSKLPA